MDDFQHRLLVALERLAGRGADDPTVGDRLDGLILVLEEIRDQLAALAEGKPSGLP